MIRRRRRVLNEALLSNEDLLSILPDKIVEASILKGKVIIVRGINVDQCANIIMKDGWRYQSNRSTPGYAIYTKIGNSIVVYSDNAYSSTIQSVADNETMQTGIAYSRKSKYPKLTFSKFWKQYNAKGFPDEEIIDAQDEILNILKSVETDEPGRFVDDYPHIKAAFANLSKSQSDEISKIWHNAMYESYGPRRMNESSLATSRERGANLDPDDEYYQVKLLMCKELAKRCKINWKDVEIEYLLSNSDRAHQIFRLTEYSPKSIRIPKPYCIGLDANFYLTKEGPSYISVYDMFNKKAGGDFVIYFINPEEWDGPYPRKDIKLGTAANSTNLRKFTSRDSIDYEGTAELPSGNPALIGETTLVTVLVCGAEEGLGDGAEVQVLGYEDNPEDGSEGFDFSYFSEELDEEEAIELGDKIFSALKKARDFDDAHKICRRFRLEPTF